MRRFLLLFLLVWGLVGCDHASKGIARHRLGGGNVVPLAGQMFELRYAENRDVAFNLLRWMPERIRSPLLLVTGTLAILGIGAALVRACGARWRERYTSSRHALALAVILAGALGNFIDRTLHGYVVDFMHIAHWPVFNVADVCVTLGAFLLLFATPQRASPEL